MGQASAGLVLTDSSLIGNRFGELCEETMDQWETKNSAEIATETPASAETVESTPVARHDFAPGTARITLRSLRAETEMQAISQALEQTNWNRKRAAQLLSISYRGLLYKIRQHNITRNRDNSSVPKRAKMADTLTNWPTTDLAVAGSGTPGED
jgi:DNA-binding NtrC family response regulator